MDFSAVDGVLEDAVRDGVFPGAVVLVRQAGEVVYRKAHGYRSLEPAQTPLNEDIVFDLASLTKPLATTIALMRFVAERKVRLDDRISRFFPNFGTHGKTTITIRQLLSHSSGLPAHQPYFEELRKRKRKVGQLATMGSQSARDFIYAQLQREKVAYEPGSQSLYSDLGFMLLGALVEDMSGMSLDQYCWEKIYRPLGLQATGFINLETLRQKKLEAATEMIAPTERCPWRKRVLCGEVHDDNAYAMGGVAGHAGLFAPIDDVDRLVNSLVECYAGAHAFLPATVVREFWTMNSAVPQSTWACGWDTPSPQGSSAGDFFSPGSVGHLGFTGTSVWIDLDRKIHVVVLSNRVHPQRNNDKITAFRPVLHNAIMQTLLDAGREAEPADAESSTAEPLAAEPINEEARDHAPESTQEPVIDDPVEAVETDAPEASITPPTPIPLTQVEAELKDGAGEESESQEMQGAEPGSPENPTAAEPGADGSGPTQNRQDESVQAETEQHPFLAGYRFRAESARRVTPPQPKAERPQARDHTQDNDAPEGSDIESLAS